MKAKGLLFILSAPSGVGKSTLARAAIAKDKRFSHSISYTTRDPRPGERNKKDYFFVDEKEFMKLVREGRFLEHARVHGRLYGTAKTTLDKALEQGKYLVLTIDVQGARNVALAYPENTVRIFIIPPDLKTWLSRLKGRQENNWQLRMENAKHEIQSMPEFDYVIVNDNLEHALNDFLAIARAEELKRNKAEFKIH